MNEVEIDIARERLTSVPLLGDAAQYLYDYKEIVNDNSDGWPHWGGSCAEALMDIVAKRAPASPEAIKKAKASIKRFCTKRGLPQPTDVDAIQPRTVWAEPVPAPAVAIELPLELPLGLTA